MCLSKAACPLSFLSIDPSSLDPSHHFLPSFLLTSLSCSTVRLSKLCTRREWYSLVVVMAVVSVADEGSVRESGRAGEDEVVKAAM